MKFTSLARLHDIHISHEKILLWTIKGLLFLTVLTPFVVSKSFFFPTLHPQTIYFRVLVEIAFVLYIFLLFQSRRYLPKLSPLLISMTLFIGILGITSFLGIYPEKSFWSTIRRAEGYLAFLHYFAYFFLLISIFRTKRHWAWFFRIAALTSILLITWHSNKKWQIFFWVLAIWNLVFLFLSATRGAWLGGITGITFLLITFFLLSHRSLFLRQRLVIFGGIGIVLAAFFAMVLGFQLGILEQNTFWERYQQLLQAVVELREERLGVWQVALQAWQDSPWIGYGLESFASVFPMYWTPSNIVPDTTFFDRTHNGFLEMLISGGIFGFLSYASLFGISVWMLLRSKILKNGSTAFILIALLIAYVTQNLFGIDFIASSILLFAFFALVHFLSSAAPQNNAIETSLATNVRIRSIHYKKFALFAFALPLILLIMYASNSPYWIASRQLESIQSARNIPELTMRLRDIQHICDSSTALSLEACLLGIRLTSSYIHTSSSPASTSAFHNNLLEAMTKAEQIIQKQSSPTELAYYFILINAYHNFSIQENRFAIFSAKSNILLKKAEDINPSYPWMYRYAGTNALLQGDKQQARILFEKAAELDNNVLKSSQWRAEALIAIGQKEQGIQVLEAGLTDTNPRISEADRLRSIRRLLVLYLANQNHQQNAALLEQQIKAAPFIQPPPELYIWLIQVYEKMNAPEKAEATRQRFQKAYPDASILQRIP